MDSSNDNFSNAIQKIKKQNPKTIICNIGTYTLEEDLEFLNQVKKQTKAKIITFGQHPSVEPEDTLKNSVIDILIKGEPEEVINDVIKNINNKKQLKTIKGVCYKRHISKEKNIIKDLDKLPFPKRPNKNYYFNPLVKHEPCTTMLITRGCPFDCSFCTVPTLYGKTFRKRSVEKVIKEIKTIINQGYKEIFFRDENLTLNKKYLTNICNEILKNKLKFSWMCNSRVDTVDLNLLKLMKQSGCHLIKFGVESGNQKTLTKLKKGTTIKQIKKTFNFCKQLNIDTLGHFMIGNPGETKKDILNTINFAIQLDPTYASFDTLLTYPGTTAKKSMISEKELEDLHNYAFRKFYLRPKYIVKNIMSTKTVTQLKNKILSSYELWYSFLT